jgi:hypothetical protein
VRRRGGLGEAGCGAGGGEGVDGWMACLSTRAGVLTHAIVVHAGAFMSGMTPTLSAFVLLL